MPRVYLEWIELDTLVFQDKTFLTWVNEEDQLRIISMEKGGDVRGVFDRLARGIQAGVHIVQWIFLSLERVVFLQFGSYSEQIYQSQKLVGVYCIGLHFAYFMD